MTPLRATPSREFRPGASLMVSPVPSPYGLTLPSVDPKETVKSPVGLQLPEIHTSVEEEEGLLLPPYQARSPLTAVTLLFLSIKTRQQASLTSHSLCPQWLQRPPWHSHSVCGPKPSQYQGPWMLKCVCVGEEVHVLLCTVRRLWISVLPKAL